jgi:hypothetical protein
MVGISRCDVAARAVAGGMNYVRRTNSIPSSLAPLNAPSLPDWDTAENEIKKTFS